MMCIHSVSVLCASFKNASHDEWDQSHHQERHGNWGIPHPRWGKCVWKGLCVCACVCMCVSLCVQSLVYVYVCLSATVLSCVCVCICTFFVSCLCAVICVCLHHVCLSSLCCHVYVTKCQKVRKSRVKILTVNKIWSNYVVLVLRLESVQKWPKKQWTQYKYSRWSAYGDICIRRRFKL